MNVGTILDRKGRHVASIDARSDLEVAALRLTSEGIGSLVVLDEHQGLLGVLSERDLVRALSLHGPSAIALTCGSMIDGVPATCSPQDSIRDVMLLMTRRRARHIPVLVDGTIVGIISIGDLVKGQLDDLELEVGVLRDYSRMRGFAPQ